MSNKDRARTLRKNMTDAEKKLWSHLRGKQLKGYKFRRHQPIGDYIVDFVCFEKQLIVEVDGGQYVEQGDYDQKRTNWLNEEEFEVIRFWNDEVLKKTDDVMQEIVRQLEANS